LTPRCPFCGSTQFYEKRYAHVRCARCAAKVCAHGLKSEYAVGFKAEHRRKVLHKERYEDEPEMVEERYPAPDDTVVAIFRGVEEGYEFVRCDKFKECVPAAPRPSFGKIDLRDARADRGGVIVDMSGVEINEDVPTEWKQKAGN